MGYKWKIPKKPFEFLNSFKRETKTFKQESYIQ